ncbi:hypothetical protein [Cupriavidus sp. AU9028]|uniref:hypothetical protein n=1 Tax=Cupriavidus sp. AU9028 TaxID=2871157 RepID=UPI001C98E1B9|nr:hypothetical protein [Cupriavidus sp. AU9028]MBY4896053.1 hypothetical protein [Cupriavidus sp. AU9028]
MLNAVRTTFGFSGVPTGKNDGYAVLPVHDTTGEFGDRGALPRIGGKSKCRRCCGMLPALFARPKPPSNGGGQGGSATLPPLDPVHVWANGSNDRHHTPAIPVPFGTRSTEAEAEAAQRLAKAYNNSRLLPPSPPSSETGQASGPDADQDIVYSRGTLRQQSRSGTRIQSSPAMGQVNQSIVAATPQKVSTHLLQMGRGGELQLHLSSMSMAQ